MKKKIVVAGATGDLGGKIIDALLKEDAEIVAITRLETDKIKISDLKAKGVNIF